MRWRLWRCAAPQATPAASRPPRFADAIPALNRYAVLAQSPFSAARITKIVEAESEDVALKSANAALFDRYFYVLSVTETAPPVPQDADPPSGIVMG